MKLNSHFAALGLALLPAVVQAAPVNVLLESAPYSCQKGPYDKSVQTNIRIMSIKGPSSDKVTVTDYTKVKGTSQWQGYNAGPLDGTKTVVELPHTWGNLPIQVAGLLSDHPIATVFNGKEPFKNCQQIKFTRIANPEKVYDALFKILDNKTPGIKDYHDAIGAYDLLPPTAFLPDLDQNDYQAKLNTKFQNFQAAFQKKLLEDAADPKNTSVVTDFRNEVTTHPVDDFSSTNQNLLLNVIDAHSSAIAVSGGNPLDDSTPPAELCKAESTLLKVFPYMGSTMLLKAVTGVATPFWTKDAANAWLSASQSCGDNGKFAQSLKYAWPSIQQKIQAFAKLKAVAAKVAALNITSLSDLASAGWLTVDGLQAYSYQLDNNFVKSYLRPVTKAARDRAMKSLTATFTKVMSNPAASAKETAGYCGKMFQRFGYISSNSTAYPYVIACVYASKPIIVSKVKAEVAKKVAEYEAMPATLDVIKKTNEFAIYNSVSGQLAFPIADAVNMQIKPIYQNANRKLGQKVDMVYADASNTIKAGFGAAMKSKSVISKDVTQLCQQIGMMGTMRAQPIMQTCNQLGTAYGQMRADVECRAKFEKGGISYDKADDYIAIEIPGIGKKNASFKKILCNAPFFENFSVSQDRGWFSTDYYLDELAGVNGKRVVMKAKLTEPDSGSKEWKLSGLIIKNGHISDPTRFSTTDSGKIAACMIAADECYSPSPISN